MMVYSTGSIQGERLCQLMPRCKDKDAIGLIHEHVAWEKARLCDWLSSWFCKVNFYILLNDAAILRTHSLLLAPNPIYNCSRIAGVMREFLLPTVLSRFFTFKIGFAISSALFCSFPSSLCSCGSGELIGENEFLVNGRVNWTGVSAQLVYLSPTINVSRDLKVRTYYSFLYSSPTSPQSFSFFCPALSDVPFFTFTPLASCLQLLLLRRALFDCGSFFLLQVENGAESRDSTQIR